MDMPTFFSAGLRTTSGKFHPIDRNQTCTEDSAVDVQKKASVPAPWKLPAFILWPPGKASNPLEDDPLPLLNHPEPAFSVFPAVSAPPIPSVNVVHSPSEGTCHPEGQRPRVSLTACQLYNRPYDANEKASLHASPPGAGP